VIALIFCMPDPATSSVAGFFVLDVASIGEAMVCRHRVRQAAGRNAGRIPEGTTADGMPARMFSCSVIENRNRVRYLAFRPWLTYSKSIGPWAD